MPIFQWKNTCTKFAYFLITFPYIDRNDFLEFRAKHDTLCFLGCYVYCLVISIISFALPFSKEGEGVKTISRKLSSFPMAWVTASPTKSSGWALSVWFCPVFSLYSGSALRGSPLLLVLCQKLATYLHHFALTWFLRHIGDFSNGVHTITLDSD